MSNASKAGEQVEELGRAQARVAELEALVADLKQSDDLLRALMDNLPDTIYFKDTESRFIKNQQCSSRPLWP